MPQVVYTNEAILPNWAARDLEAEIPDNFYVVRKATGWNTVQDMVEIIRLLGRILTRIAPHRQAILMLDGAAIHLNSAIFDAAAAVGLWVVLIPSMCTWLLQPLDVYIFARFKAALESRAMERRSIVRFGHPTAHMIRYLFEAVEEIFTARSWAHAFDRLGLNGDVAPTSTNLLKSLQWDAFPHISRERPSNEQLALSWPRRHRIPWEEYKAVMPAEPLLHPALPAPGPAPALPPAEPEDPVAPPPRRRLRVF